MSVQGGTNCLNGKTVTPKRDPGFIKVGSVWWKYLFSCLRLRIRLSVKDFPFWKELLKR